MAVTDPIPGVDLPTPWDAVAVSTVVTLVVTAVVWLLLSPIWFVTLSVAMVVFGVLEVGFEIART